MENVLHFQQLKARYGEAYAGESRPEQARQEEGSPAGSAEGALPRWPWFLKNPYEIRLMKNGGIAWSERGFDQDLMIENTKDAPKPWGDNLRRQLHDLCKFLSQDCAFIGSVLENVLHFQHLKARYGEVYAGESRPEQARQEEGSPAGSAAGALPRWPWFLKNPYEIRLMKNGGIAWSERGFDQAWYGEAYADESRPEQARQEEGSPAGSAEGALPRWPWFLKNPYEIRLMKNGGIAWSERGFDQGLMFENTKHALKQKDNNFGLLNLKQAFGERRLIVKYAKRERDSKACSATQCIP
ncbi:Dynein Assembly Factor 1, Axonemal [Manis pentadactyla]|nr:Dynein Assembly Factor 1, Axonemal [Manis pentadactyla]